MRKLKLNLNELAVDSFEATPFTAGAGTVHAYVTYLNCTPNCESVRICDPTVVGTDLFDDSCNLECTGSCGYTNCAGNCTYGQTNGETCACATAITCAPNC